MAREVWKLSSRSVATIARPGRHSDGAGLYLVVDPSGARRWLFLFRWQGKLKKMGLGGIGGPRGAEGRPQPGRGAAERARAEATTFGAFAAELVEELRPGFRNAKHAAQWSTTLTTYAGPLWPRPLDAIGTDDVLEVLKPIWTTKAETASRVRGRIERVLDAARARGLRSGENPARWRGHLDHLLSARLKLTRGHHAAMPFAEVPAFVAALRKREGLSALALEFLILSASRFGEVAGATWSEIDRKAMVWTIPAARIKAGREHRVPLTARAIEILAEAEKVRTSDHVFPGAKRGKPLSNGAFDALMGRMGVENVTAHGFRSSFRDWAGEATAFPCELAEAALAHVVGDQTERAYRRGDALMKRRKLMEAWAGFVGGERVGKVVQLGRGAG